MCIVNTRLLETISIIAPLTRSQTAAMAAQQPPDLAGLIDAIIAAANAAAANNPPPPPIPPAPPAIPTPFALVPGAVTNAPLDFNKQSEAKLFHRGSQGLEPKFDLKEGNLHIFLAKLKEHARIYNWDDILEVPDTGAVARNLISHYGMVSIENCTAHARTYVNTPSRNAQNSMMLFQCLSKSLTDEASIAVLANATTYTVDTKPSGTCLLKTIIGKASIDTKAKVLLLREMISSLHMKMVELNGDVTKFNIHVATVRDSLIGRGQSADELVAHLFKAYDKVNDPQFNTYINSKRDDYDDGTDITADSLMGSVHDRCAQPAHDHERPAPRQQ